MTRLKTLLMATAAIAAMAFMPTTTALAMGPTAFGTAPVTTASTLGKAGLTLKSTALQAKSFFDTMQFGTALKTVIIAGDKKAGDTKKATTTEGWAAITRDKVGYHGMPAQASKVVKLKAVAIIDKAKHPAVEYAHQRFHSLGVGTG